MAKAILTQARLKELLHYSIVTGKFYWLIARSGKARSGSIAGGLRTDGYVAIRIDGIKYRANRLAWLYVVGTWPTDIVW